MNTAVRVALLALAALLALPLALIVLFSAVLSDSAGAWSCAPAAAPSGSGAPVAGQWPAVGDWSGEQVGNAAVVVQVGVEMAVPPYGWTVAVATAMQESSLRNLDHQGEKNDHDSIGLFQQRPSQGWGTREQLLDPRYAARKFFEKLLTIDGWQNMALTDAAQAVQVSGHPQEYAKHQSAAQQIVDYVRTRLGVSCSAGGTGTWQLPLPKGSYDFGSPYGPRGDAMHRGVDLMAPEGTPILAAAAGKVTSAGCTSAYCDRPGNPNLPGCGLAIEIQHDGGIGTTYCHAIRMYVTVGQQVKAGERIADVGTTGHSSGNHLHFQVHKPAPPISNDTTIDPVPFMRSVGVEL